LAARHPTVLLPVGDLAGHAIARLRAAVDLRQPLVRVLDPTGPQGRQRLDDGLRELLRVGREGAAAAEPRLDLIAMVDLAEGRARSRLLGISRLVSDLLAESYGRVFPADAPVDQRTAALHVVASCPPLAATPATVEITAALSALETWAAKEARHPVLAKVWLVPSQTSAGVLTEDDVAAAMAGFALPCLVGEVRASEAMRDRLAHPRHGEGRVGFLSVATLDVPVGRIRDYARARAAFEALDTLVERVQRRAGDAGLALDQLGALSANDLFSAFDDGDESRRLRDLAWRLAGGPELPERIAVGPFATAEDLRVTYAELYAPALKESEAGHTVQGALESALNELERAEAIAQVRVHTELEQLLSSHLGGVHRLDRLPETEAALGHLVRRLEDERKRDSDDVDAPISDDSLGALQEATAALPDPAILRAAGAALGVAVGVLGFAVAVAVLGDTGAAPTGLSATQVTTTAPTTPSTDYTGLVPWAVAALLTAVTTWAGSRLLGSRTHGAVQEALEARREALEALKARGTGAIATRRAESALRLHRHRSRRDAIAALERAQARLRTIRAAIVAARDRAADHLAALGVRPEQLADGVSHLLEGSTRLHGHLVGPDALGRWLARGRRWADAASWADRVLERTWPGDGLGVDVPAADLDAVLDVSREQVEHLDRRSLFDDGDAAREAAEQAARFASRATMALAPGCVPRNPHGDAVMGVRAGELLTVGPLVARSALEDALVRADVHLGATLWADLGAPRLSFVRTWEGYTAAEIARGAGIQGRPL
jgi:hypothetical protein